MGLPKTKKQEGADSVRKNLKYRELVRNFALAFALILLTLTVSTALGQMGFLALTAWRRPTIYSHSKDKLAPHKSVRNATPANRFNKRCSWCDSCTKGCVAQTASGVHLVD